MSSLEITVIRHAPTESNALNIYMGQLDIPILGIDPGSKYRFRELLSQKTFTACYSSPLSRARETALTLFPNADIRIDQRIIERGLGDWSGISKEKIRNQTPLAFSHGGNSLNFFYTPPNGESWQLFVTRVAGFLVNLFDEGKETAVVSHNGVIRVMKSLISGQDITDSYTNNEPHLVPQVLSLTERTISRIRDNPFYTTRPD